MIRNQGELALIFEIDEALKPRMIGYRKPEKHIFNKTEVVDSFLSAPVAEDTLGDFKAHSHRPKHTATKASETRSTYTKYKTVDQKVRPVMASQPEEFRIERYEIGDPLQYVMDLPTHPTDFEPKGRYTEERMRVMDKVHEGDFIWPEERKLMHQLVAHHNEAFAWDDTERGSFDEVQFPPVKIATIAHVKSAHS